MQPVMSSSTISYRTVTEAARTSGPPKRRLRTASDWRAYFEGNRERLLVLPWDAPINLSDDEWTAVAWSVQQFQLGESSEGTHLRQRAEVYAARTADPAYAEAIELFITEEQRHARDLGRFLDRVGLERL
ncbi:MAG: hypothetical protein ACR2GR_09560 [Rhodothermales bacterium]